MERKCTDGTDGSGGWAQTTMVDVVDDAGLDCMDGSLMGSWALDDAGLDFMDGSLIGTGGSGGRTPSHSASICSRSFSSRIET